MLPIIMFMNGLCLMVLEMVGARLLAPWLGTSTIVWTSLIGVILAFLSLGYWLGGKLADNLLTPRTSPHHEGKEAAASPALHTKAKGVLARLLLCAALGVMLSALLQQPLLGWLTAQSTSLYINAVLAAVVLFALPGLVSGMISPFTMRLAITSQAKAGSTIGRLNAISTVGSIVGTFLGGFVLISWFGSREILYGIAACYLVVALCTHRLPASAWGAALVLFCASLGFEWIAQVHAAATHTTTLETPYNTLRIQEGFYSGRPARFLSTDPGSAQSGIFLDNPQELMFAYTKFYRLGTALVPQPSRVLMLGGGGYSVPKWLLGNNGPLGAGASLDVVELDPGVTRMAKEFFNAPLEDSRMQVFHEDARTFINRAAQASNHPTYSLIFADVFNSHYTVPFHIGTREAASTMRSLLDDNGVLLMNIISAVDGDNGRLLRGIYHAFQAEFAEVVLLPVQSKYEGTMVQNVMLLAFPKKGMVTEETLATLPPDVRAMYESRWTRPVAEDVPALADNFAPVERYMLRTQE